MTNDKENEGVKEHPFLSFFFWLAKQQDMDNQVIDK